MNKEEKVLENLLKLINQPDEISLKQNIIKFGSIIFGIVLLLISYIIMPKGLVVEKVSLVIGVFGGIFIMFWSYYSSALNYNHYLKKYLNKKAIENRLNDIKNI